MGNKRWNNEQLQILKDKYADEEWDTLEELLYPFTKQEIQHKAYLLKIKRQNYYWTNEEIEYLKQHINSLSYKQLSEKLNKKPQTISTKAYKLDLLSSHLWTEEELSILREMYPHKTSIQIAKYIRRKPQDINSKAKKLGLKKCGFSHYDLDLFLDKFKKFAMELGRTPFIREVSRQTWSPSVMTINRYFGGYKKLCEVACLEVNANVFGSVYPAYISKNGDLCWSKAELIITNFFVDNGISYKREQFYNNYIDDNRCNTKTCDWIINNNVFVEYFGMMDKDYYLIKANEKINICQNNNIRLIALTEKDIRNLDKIFEEFIPN